MRPAARLQFQDLALLLALALAPLGCTGTVGNGQNPGSAGNTGTGTAGSGSGTAGSIATGTAGSIGTGTAGSIGTGTAGSGVLATCPSTASTPMPLRRLTKFEYTNTTRNLLNVTSTAANDLPADEVTEGFNNQAAALTVSSLHAEKYVLVSEALAKEAVKSVSTLAPCNTATKTEDACAMDFANSFGRRAFRRPVTAQDRQVLMAAYTAGRTGGTYAEGIEVMIRAALQSAHFLYRLELTAPADANAQLVPISQYEMATRLSYLIWASGPDDGLLDAAGRGELADKTMVAAKARAMLADPKARVAITDFYNQWIGTSRLDITTKSSAFPAYTAAVRDAMKAETPAFVQYVLWSGDHRLETLLTSPVGFVSSALAPIYGVSTTSTTPQMMTLPAAQGRSGVLTQAGFLAAQAHPDQTSPVLRGKFVRTRLMCQNVPMPPMDVDITPPAVTSAPTARERFAAHESAGGSCISCHVMMDPIGLAFETFDAIGQFRTTENGATIDVSGMIVGSRDVNGAFTGVRDLAGKLAASDQVRDCVATQWFRYAAGRTEEVPDGCSLTTLQDAFGASGGDLTELVVAMTQTDAFWYRAPIAQ
jgi:uncharacterized protein DUF1592/uncharacterized protein DUF1588/uncharacterized protein DUF1587/uncharacterized protein DUF1595/uncharacterized protein DUF1585